MSDAPPSPRRPTGSIPLSWARPAEDVSADVDKSAGPNNVVIAVVVAALVVVGVVVLSRAGGPTSPTTSPTTPPTTPSVTETRPPKPPPTTPVPIDKAPEPAQANAAIAPEDDDAVADLAKKNAPNAAAPATPAKNSAANSTTTTEAQKKLAQAALKACRLAARDGDNAKAVALAEDAVDADPRCYECWSTLAFLRGKLGDAEGQRAAKMQARALKPPTATPPAPSTTTTP